MEQKQHNMKRIARINDKGVTVIPKFEQNEIIVLEEKLNNVMEFKKLNINFDKIVEVHEKIIFNLDKQVDLLGFIVEFLNLYKTFLFHWEKLLKNRYGAESNNYKEFQVATNLEYDGCFSYRFVNELRNYVQHCGYPNIIFDSELVENDKTAYSLLLYSSELIEDYDWKPRILKELKERAGVNLLIVMLEVVNCLYRINNVALNLCVDITKLYKDLINLLNLEKLKNDDTESIALIEYVNFREKKIDEIDFLYIEFNYLKKVMSEMKFK